MKKIIIKTGMNPAVLQDVKPNTLQSVINSLLAHADSMITKIQPAYQKVTEHLTNQLKKFNLENYIKFDPLNKQTLLKDGIGYTLELPENTKINFDNLTDQITKQFSTVWTGIVKSVIKQIKNLEPENTAIDELSTNELVGTFKQSLDVKSEHLEELYFHGKQTFDAYNQMVEQAQVEGVVPIDFVNETSESIVNKHIENLIQLKENTDGNSKVVININNSDKPSYARNDFVNLKLQYDALSDEENFTMNNDFNWLQDILSNYDTELEYRIQDKLDSEYYDEDEEEYTVDEDEVRDEVTDELEYDINATKKSLIQFVAKVKGQTPKVILENNNHRISQKNMPLEKLEEKLQEFIENKKAQFEDIKAIVDEIEQEQEKEENKTNKVDYSQYRS